MRFNRILSLVSIAAKFQNVAAYPNAFTNPLGHSEVHAGETIDITWTELAGNEASISLVRGDPPNLETVRVVANNLPNNGAVRWSVSDQIAPGEYALKIDSDGKQNYSPKFKILDAVTPNTDEAKAQAMNAIKKNRHGMSKFSNKKVGSPKI